MKFTSLTFFTISFTGANAAPHGLRPERLPGEISAGRTSDDDPASNPMTDGPGGAGVTNADAAHTTYGSIGKNPNRMGYVTISSNKLRNPSSSSGGRHLQGCYDNKDPSPTWHPVYSADWTNNGHCRLTIDCNSPSYPTELACCKGAYAGQISGFCLMQLPSPPTTSPTLNIGGLPIYYPRYDLSWNDAFCTNTRPVPSGRPTYSNMLACCKGAYGGQIGGKCLSMLPAPPSTLPTNSATEAKFWYPMYETSWDESGCSNKLPLPYNSVNDRPNYPSQLECCTSAYGGQMSGSCLAMLSSPAVHPPVSAPDPVPQPPPPFSPEIFFLLEAIPLLVAIFKEYETPLAARWANYYDSTWWNCVAVYSEGHKDTFTKERPAVISPDVATYTTKDRAGCVTQATASLNDVFFGGDNDYITKMLEKFELVIEPKIPQDIRSCGDDTECLTKIASQENYNPTTMGHIVAQQTYSYATTDGFNMLGTDDGCTVSCRPYSDITGYEPVNMPGRWKPLMESNGRGFFYEQEFVTPQIGKKAKFRFLPESERTNRVVRDQNYSYTHKAEMEEVIAQMALLDDYKKVEIETFDNKLYVTVSVIESFVNNVLVAGATAGFSDTQLGQEGYILSLERLLHFNMGLTASEFDSIIIAWKEKVAKDLVRPTTVIKERGDEEITTWAPGGVQTFKARDFEAYIRVMPHSEYTSGSSCLFQALEEYVKDYMVGLGIDTPYPVSFPPVAPGNSVVEPGIVPASEIKLEYDSIKDMSDAGSQSRFDGGMHFADSVPAGKELCTGIGNIAAGGSVDLI